MWYDPTPEFVGLITVLAFFIYKINKKGIGYIHCDQKTQISKFLKLIENINGCTNAHH